MKIIANMTFFLSAASMLTAASLLPEPFEFPKEPVPEKSCLKLSAADEKPRLHISGIAEAKIRLDPFPIVRNNLLTIYLGHHMPFHPAEVYQIYLPNHQKGYKNRVIVKFEMFKKILFKVDFDEMKAITYKSTNFPGYELERENDDLLLSDGKRRLEYLFRSDDGGYFWRLVEIRHMEFKSRKIECEYDEDDLLTAINLPGGGKFVLRYENGLVSRVIDPNHLETRLDWDDAGNVRRIETRMLPKHPFFPPVWPGKRPAPLTVRSIQVECDSKGRLLSLVDSLGRPYFMEYRGDVDRKQGVEYLCGVITNPSGAKTFCRTFLDGKKGVFKANKGFLSIDGGGGESFDVKKKYFYKLKSQAYMPFLTESKGVRREIKRDGPTVAVTAVEAGDAYQRKYKLNDHGLLSGIERPDGTFTVIERDEDDRVVKEAVGSVGETRSHDDAGRLVAVSENGLTTRYRYDDHDRPIETLTPDGTIHKFKWDDALRLRSRERSDGVAVKYRYHGNLPVLKEVATVSADGKDEKSTKFHFDPNGFLKKIERPDGSYQAFYYKDGKLIRRSDGPEKAVKHVYDERGNRIASFSDDERIRREYDERGNLIKTTYPDGRAETLVRDGLGRIVKRVAPDGSWVAYDFDASGNKIREKRSDRSEKIFKHDENGRVAAIIQEPGPDVFREYDSSNRLVKIEKVFDDADGDPKTETTSIVYDRQGRRIETVLPDGSSEKVVYESNSDKIKYLTRNGTATHYSRDDAGRIVAISQYPAELLEGAKTEKELEKLAADHVVNRFSHDEWGKRRLVRNDAPNVNGNLTEKQ